MARPRISFCSSISVGTVSPSAQRLQQRLVAAIDVLDHAAAVDREPDGGPLGPGAFEHHGAVMDHLHRWIEFFDFHRDRNGFAAHRDKMIDIYSVFARDDAADADGLLADWRQHLAAVDHDEIVGAAAIVAVQQHKSSLAPSVPDHVA